MIDGSAATDHAQPADALVIFGITGDLVNTLEALTRVNPREPGVRLRGWRGSRHQQAEHQGEL